MNKLKITLLLILSCIFFNACGQNSERKLKIEVMEYSEQTGDILANQLKRYDFEPNYQISIDTKNSYDLLINDYLIDCDYGSYKQWHQFFINWGILKSGKQRLQIKLYPEFINGKLSESLKNEDYLELEVSYFIWSRDNTGIEKRIDVLKYELPRRDINNRLIDYSQKKELTIDLEFNANVPYELKGWTDGIVFDKKDSLQLKRRLAAIYDEYIYNYKNKKFDNIRAISLYRSYEIAQSIYKNKEDFQKGYEKLIDEELNFLPLENYDIYFYGAGRMITLRRTDNKYLGDSPCIRTYINDRGVKRNQILDMFFYQPQGSDKLVLIR